MEASSAVPATKSRFRVFTVHDPTKGFTDQPDPPAVREIPVDNFAIDNIKNLTRTDAVKDQKIIVSTFGVRKQYIAAQNRRLAEAEELTIENDGDYRARSTSYKRSAALANVHDSSFLTIDSREVPPLAHNYQLTDDRAKHMQHMPPRPSLADLQQNFLDNSNSNGSGQPTATIDRNGNSVRFCASGTKNNTKADVAENCRNNKNEKQRPENTSGEKKQKVCKKHSLCNWLKHF